MITSLQTFSSGNVLAWHEASLKYAACREFAYIESSLALASCLCELSLCAFRAATIRWLWDYRKESLPARKISIHSFQQFAYIESSLALASCLCELSLCAFRAATIRWLWDYRKESLPARKISIHSFQRMAHVRAISA